MESSLTNRLFRSFAGHWDVVVSLAIFLGLSVSLGAFAIVQLSARRYRDPELANRHKLAGAGAWPGEYFSWATRPLLRLLQASRLGPTAVTLMSLHLAMGAAAAVATNRLTLGGWLFVMSGTCDFLDGKLARSTSAAGPKGAVLDSVVDRYVDAIMWIGIAWLYRSHWILVAVLLAQLGSFAVPYVRARVEALGTSMANVGWFQRPERVALLAVGLIGGAIGDWMWKPAIGWPPSPLLAGVVVVMALASHICALQRLLFAQTVLTRQKNAAARTYEPVGFNRSSLTVGLSTCIDFAFALWFVKLGVIPSIATSIGCGLGAVFNFTVNRIWASGYDRVPSRYALVSTLSALLNGGLVALLLLAPNLDFVVVWVIVRVLVSLTWNLPMRSNYGFVHRLSGARRKSPASEEARAES